jgi:NADH-quinone oxidoreductase subunit J
MTGPLFYLFALFTFACALGTVLSRNAVNGALCLLLSLVGVAGIFVLLDAYLLAALLILVYAGAVVALFLFIIMLLDVQGGIRRPVRAPAVAAGLVSAALLGYGVWSLVRHSGVGAMNPAVAEAGPVGAVLKHYAEMLFTVYLLPVQVMGFLLLIAMLGVIVLSRRLDGMEDVK